MFNRFTDRLTRSSQGRKTRRSNARRQNFVSELKRSLRLESLEDRRLLASDVTIGNVDAGNFTRTLVANTATYEAIDDAVQIAATTIQNDLNAGFNVVVTTDSPAIGGGDLVVANAVGAATTVGNIALIATTTVVNADIQTAGNVSITSTGFFAIDGASIFTRGGNVTIGGGYVSINASNITTNGGDITIGGAADPVNTPAVGGAGQSQGVFTGSANLASSGGAISIRGRGIDGAAADLASGVFVFQSSIQSSNGSITVVGDGGNGSGVANTGISVVGSNMIATGSGDISLTGVASGTGDFQDGVFLDDNNGGGIPASTVQTMDGSISINGTGSPVGGMVNAGVILQSGTNNILSNGSGSIDIFAMGGRFDIGGIVGISSGFVAEIGADVIGGVEATGPITIVANDLEMDQTIIDGSGDLLIAPIASSSRIDLGVAGTAGGQDYIELTDLELGFIDDGFLSVTIGDAANGSGPVNVESAAFVDPVAIVGGSFSVTNGLTGDGGVTLIARDATTAGQDITITSGTLFDASGDILLSAGDNVTIDPAVTINAPNGALTVNVDPVVGDQDAEGGTLSLGGSINTAANTALNGGDDADTFLPASTSAFFDISGGDPATSPGDTLVVSGLGEGVTVSASMISFGNASSSFDGIELIQVTNSGNINVLGDDTDNGLSFAAHPTLPNTAMLSLDLGPDVVFDTLVTTDVRFTGADGDDTLTIDFSNGIPTTNINFDGGSNASTTSGDEMFLIGSPTVSATQVTFDYFNANDGFIDVDGLAQITYTGLEPITSSIAADNVTLNYSAATETIAVSQMGTDITVDSVAGEITTFVAPNNNLTINTGGGTDTVTIDGLNVNLAGSFSVDDPSGPTDDTVIFATGASTIITGSLDLPVPQIQVNVDLSVDGDVSLGSATGTGQIQTSATISSSGEVVFDEPVTLTGATTVATDADSLVAFHFAIDGNQDLSVTGGTGVEFLAENGVLMPIANLTATATNGSIRLDDFTTFGNQTYNSPVVTGAGGGTVDIISTAGVIAFASTIVNGSTPADSLSTDSDGETTFGGEINSLDALSVRASGTIVLSNDITVLSDIDISTADSGDDNLIIQGPAVITTGAAGSVMLNVLDNVDIQTGSTINTLNLSITVDDPTTADDIGAGSTALVNGTLNVGNLTTVVGGDDADTFSITPQTGSAFDINGGDPVTSPGDSLNLDAGGNNVDIDAAGQISIAGAQPVATLGIESLSLSNVDTLTITGDTDPNLFVIAADPNVVGGDVLSIGSILQLSISAVNAIVYNGSDGDDAFQFNAASGMPTTPVTFNGQGQDGASGGDQIAVIGTFTTQTLNYTAPGADGNNGTIDLDGTVVTYTGLEPINAGDATDTILNFSTGLANNATLQNNSNDGSIEIVDNGATFEDTFIPNPTNSLTINLGDQGDTLAINALDAAYAASMIVNGGAGVDDVQLNNVTISNTPGRGLDVTDVETLGITNSTFSGNTADIGAGLRVVGGTTTINGSTFSGNTANGDAANQGGGGIFNNSLMTIQNGSMITGNTASGGLGSGGGILVGAAGTLTVLDSTISGNSANRAGGGIDSQTANDLTLTNVTLDSNVAGITPVSTAAGNGGGLHATGDTRTFISGGTITNNTATAEGGGLWNDSGTMTIQGGTLVDNNRASGPAADDGGGGIFNNGGTLIINDAATVISNNTADGTSGSGGGIHSVGGMVSITDALLDGNTATIDGGGLFADGQGSVTFTDARVVGNVAGDSGGGAFIDGPTTTISTTTFTANQAQGNQGLDGDGGGLFVRGQSGTGDFTVTTSTFDSNSALGGGGGAFFVDIDGAINGGSFALNQVTGNGTTFDTGGGGLVIVGETTVPMVSLSGVTVDENTAPSAAGIGIVDSQLTIDNSVIRNNVATSPLSGAGGIGALTTVQLAGDLLSIQNSNVIDNTTAGEGGGLGIINGDISVFTTTISGNQAMGGRGGGVGLLNNGIAGTATFDSSTISANTASESGGGIAVLNFGLDLENVTLSTNDAGTVGGGIGYDNNVDSVNERISFSTITSNTSSAGGSNIAATGEPIGVIGSIFNDGDSAVGPGVLNSLGNNLDSGNTSGFSGPGDLINTDPLLGPLQDNGGPAFTHALLTGSPAIDAGPVTGPATDARGFTRPLDGDGNGSLLFDIGAVEGESAVAVLIDDVTVNENAGTATVVVRLPGAIAGGFTVDFATADGTAIQPGDYATATGTLTFAGTADETQTFTVSIVDDAIVEGLETILISLSNSSNVMVDTSDTALLTITDDDSATLNVNDVTVTEVDGNVTITVTVDNAVQGGFTVDYTTSDGTATQPADYISATGTLTFTGTANESQTFTVSIVDDTMAELLETINISLSNVSNSSVDATDTAVITIAESDNASALSIDDVTVDEDAGTATVIVRSPGAIAGGFTVDFATADGTAIQPGDYATATGTLTFAGTADETQTFTVSIVDDVIVEGPETILISLSNSSNVMVDTSDTALLTIVDDDSATLNVNDVTVDEDAGTATVTVTVDNAVQSGFTVDFATSDGTATQPADYISAAGTLTFIGTANESQTFTVSIVDDTMAESLETINISLSNVSNSSVDATDTAVINITDNENTSALSIDDVTVDEDAGRATVTVRLNNTVAGGFTVDFETTDGTAVQPGDYTSSTGTLTFAGTANETQSFTVPIIDDLLVEPGESFLVTLLNPSNLEVDASDTALVNITDNDMATIEVGDISIDELAGNALVPVSVFVVGVQGGFTVDFMTVNGMATQPSDYTTTSGTLTFGGTSLSQNITIPIIADAIAEGDEKFTVVLSNVTPLGPNPAPVTSIDATDIGTVTITESVVNVDVGTSISDSPDPVLVGSNVAYTVTVTNLGSNAATGVVSTTTVPAGLEVNEAVSSIGAVNVNGGVVTADIGTLPIGASAIITINATAGGNVGSVTVNSTVSVNENDTDLNNNVFSEDTTINVPPSAIINGRVTCDVLQNSIVVRNEPIASAVVFLDANNNGQRDGNESRTLTDPSGFYQFDNVPATTANVTVEVPMSCNTITDDPGILRSTVEIGHLARSIASADIDLDGDLDLLVVGDTNLVAGQDHSDSLTIVHNTPSGFSTSSIIKLGDRPQSVFAFQPDPSKPAIIAVAAVGDSTSGGAVYTIQGQGLPVRQAAVGGPIDVLVDDLNDDGLPDTLSASLHQSILQFGLGGSSEIVTIESETSQILSIASGNLVGTSAREVLVAGYGFKPNPQLPGLPTILELYGINSAGVLARIGSVDTPPEAVRVAVVDIIGNEPGDGFDDNVDEIAVLFHTGKMLIYPMVNGAIGNPIETQIEDGATAFDFSDRIDANNEFVDFNRDGNVDVAIANLGANSVELYVGAGNGQFSMFSLIDDVFAPSDLVVDDFNGDGFADVAVSSFYGEKDVNSDQLDISRPGLTTILQLEIASRSVSVTSNSVTQEDFLFRSAIPQVMMDTTGDNRITALDALRVINMVDRNLAAEGEQVAVARSATDVNGDGRTSAVDALMIINYLSQDAEGEGSQVLIGDLINTDDADDRDELIAALDLALTQGLV